MAINKFSTRQAWTIFNFFETKKTIHHGFWQNKQKQRKTNPQKRVNVLLIADCWKTNVYATGYIKATFKLFWFISAFHLRSIESLLVINIWLARRRFALPSSQMPSYICISSMNLIDSFTVKQIIFLKLL